jgi:hypothetical protein
VSFPLHEQLELARRQSAVLEHTVDLKHAVFLFAVHAQIVFVVKLFVTVGFCAVARGTSMGTWRRLARVRLCRRNVCVCGGGGGGVRGGVFI